ncbi:MAG TPA: mechanosensitive ion channel domain-containing protein [Flavobacteriaceae bacterium]|nr:mechanosensitive ion channel domain-containing protein [Flavobacteriaceae bacterium]
MIKKALENYSRYLQDFLIEQGMTEDWAMFLNVVINSLIVVGVLVVFDIVLRRFLVEAFRKFSLKTKTTFDDYLVTTNFPKFVTRLLPLALLRFLIPILFIEYPLGAKFAMVVLKVYLVILGVLIIRSILRTAHLYLAEDERYGDKPLASYVQVLMIFAWGIGGFWIIQLLTGQSVKSLATLGAASAVILLIFKDTILGFVASIQISVNDMVRIGDWITFKNFGADGFVVEISLATVRVQNWDKTYTTIPTYSLISDSFQNWRGMQESGGRRIKRSIHIKQSSIKFLNEEDLERMKKISIIKPYIEHRQRDIDKYNERIGADKKVQINGRNQTNLGIFRHYVDAVLKKNTAIHKEYSLMVRQLAPTENGLPIEIYCFSKDIRWVNYERIQADIFDHLLAALPYFDLEVFELPTGKDVRDLKTSEN